jgi:hypothetical protein
MIVKVWETNYCRLLRYAAKLQLDSGQKITLNDAIKSLLDAVDVKETK